MKTIMKIRAGQLFFTVKLGILFLATFVLLCIPHMTQTALAQGTSYQINSYNAMAALAEKELRVKEHAAHLEKDSTELKVIAISTMNDDTENHTTNPERTKTSGK